MDLSSSRELGKLRELGKQGKLGELGKLGEQEVSRTPRKMVGHKGFAAPKNQRAAKLEAASKNQRAVKLAALAAAAEELPLQEREATLEKGKRDKLIALTLTIIFVILVLLIWRAGAFENGSSGAEDAETSGDKTTGVAGIYGEANDSPVVGVMSGTGSANNMEAAPPGIRVPKTSCPVSMPSSDDLHYVKSNYLESWKTLSDLECRDFATELLIGLRDSGYSLVRSDFMDLSGESWSCVVKNSDSEVYVVTMTPQYLGSTRSASNRLNVTLLHYFSPEITIDS